MNVCILSMQRVQNFGSLLQSYALKKMLEETGCHVDFLDIEPNTSDNALLNGMVQTYREDREKTDTFFSKVSRCDKYVFNRLSNKLLSKRQDEMFEAFRKRVLHITDGVQKSAYDLCVIGSDEVFNCLSSTRWGFTGQLFGDIPQAKRVATYAASCGSTTLANVPDHVAKRISESFENVSLFSVRDDNTSAFVSALSGKTPELHLDPAAVMDFSEELAGIKPEKKRPKRYCLVYSYYNRIYDKQDISEIQKFCRKNGLKLVAAGSPQKWIKDYRVLDPFELLDYFAHAEFIITDTFHGTLFSVKYAKRFAILVRDSNRNKLEDLIDRLQLQQHRIRSYQQLEGVYQVQKDDARLQRLLKRERERTMQYLHCACAEAGKEQNL